MSEDSTLLARQAVYVDRVRGLQRGTRNLGYLACLAGVLMLLAGRFMRGAPHLLLWVGLASVIAGWALFAWSMFRRAAWVRANPFEITE